MKDPRQAIKEEMAKLQERSEHEQQVFDWLCDNPQSMRRIVWHLLDTGYLTVCEVAEMRERIHEVNFHNFLSENGLTIKTEDSSQGCCEGPEDCCESE